MTADKVNDVRQGGSIVTRILQTGKEVQTIAPAILKRARGVRASLIPSSLHLPKEKMSRADGRNLRSASREIIVPSTGRPPARYSQPITLERDREEQRFISKR
jgi:hypothetical protein